MSFVTPAILLALLVLPILWWLLRATPPAPRQQKFPAIRLLSALRPREETPARTPWWLLALRLAAAALIIIGLAGPTFGGGGGLLPGRGPLLLVLDNGYAAAPDWQARIGAANGVLDEAARQGRDVSLLTTAAGAEPLRATPPQPAALLRPRLAAVAPVAWQTDRGDAAAVIKTLQPGPTAYIADGVAAPGDAAFAAALAARGAVTELRGTLPARILSVSATAAGLVAHLAATPAPAPRDEQVLAETGDGHVLASVPLHLAAGAATATTQLNLPPELRNQLAALRLARAPGAASVFLLDESARRRPVGLLSASGADTPLLGADFYVERALAPYAEIRRGDLASLLARPLSVLVAPDRTLTGDDAAKIDAWVRQGGFLIRFAGPDMAADAQDLLPEKLMAGDRQLGGALSWTQPQHLAPFPPGPFAGVPASPEVTVNRQVLAEPGGAAPASATWATLRDGTPLVTAAPHGAGEIVLFHVTANADWSNLPLSGLFVDMLRRLVQRAAGVATALDARPLPPAQALDGFGVLGPPPPGARPLAAAELGSATPSPAHPPGFYGLAQDRHAFNLGGHVRLAAAPLIPHATEQRLDGAAVMVKLGPWAIALALLLLCADLLLTLRLRGLLRPAFAALLLLALMPAAHAQTAASGSTAEARPWPRTSPMSSPATRRWTAPPNPAFPGCRTTSTTTPPRCSPPPPPSPPAATTSASTPCCTGRSPPAPPPPPTSPRR